MSTTTLQTVAALEALLPESLQQRIDPELVTEPPSAAALRVLATLRDERWTEHVRTARIDWQAMLAWSRGDTVSRTAALRVEIAASLAGVPAARLSLLAAATALDERNFAAVLEALWIARTGLAS